MAFKESEVRVLAILGLVILILWAFFGLFWSLLLVFTFLVYAYNFGRHQNSNRYTRHEIEKDEPDATLYQEKLHGNYPESQDLPFTGLPKGQFTLRSPMPLLSEVTKRLSFNARSNSPLKRTTPDHVNPCSRATVLSALKESRKRSFVVDEEEDLELLLRPTKRRGTKPVDSMEVDSTHECTFPLNRPFFGGLKRAAIHNSKEMSTEENTSKRSKVMGHSVSSKIEQDHRQTQSAVQKRKNIGAVSTHDTSKEGSESCKSKKPKNSPTADQAGQSSATVEREDTHKTVDSTVPGVGDSDHNTDAAMTDSELEEPSTKKLSSSETENVVSKPQQTITAAKSDDHQNEGSDIQPTVSKDTETLRRRLQKRFTVPRFPSKEDSRRRAVPVYCASNEESEMPQRRTVTRKINQEQIKIDRKLAWERVRKFLDDDDDEDEDEEGEASKSGTTVVSSTISTTCTSSSLFKILTAQAVTSAGTITTTTTQSLITPALAAGYPEKTTVSQGGITLAQTSQGNTAVTKSQASIGSLLQSRQTLGSGLFTNLSSVPGMLLNISTASPSATIKQTNLVITTCTSGNASSSTSSLTGLQANVTLQASAVPGLGTGGFQFSPAPSSGKPSGTEQLTSLSDPGHKNKPPSGFQLGPSMGQSAAGSTVPTAQNTVPKVGFSFPSVSSSSVSWTSASATAPVLGDFTFAAPGGTQSGSILNKLVSQSKPGAGSVNNSSAFASAPSPSQNPVAFGVNPSTSTIQASFGTLTKTSQSAASTSSAGSSSIFGHSTITAQTQNKSTFGSTNMQPLSGSQPAQIPFGGTSSSAFGGTLNKSSTQSPFSQTAFGVQSNQSTSQGAFGANPTQNAFGPQQNQPVAQSPFGRKSAFTQSATQSPFGTQLNQPAPQSALGTQATQNAFVNQPATQSAFGTQATQNAFGTQLNQPAPPSAFGTQATQNAFGAQLNQPGTQSAFGAPTTSKSFSFAVSTAAQTSSSSPFSSFGNKPASQSAFGAVPSQNAAAGPSGGFNFSAPASNSATGGFNFSAAGTKTGGFQFGPGSTSSFGTFGQTTAQTASPLATPATPAPSGGFNFAPAGGMSGQSPFTSSMPAAPAFGSPSTPQDGSSALTARTRARLAARRRGKK